MSKELVSSTAAPQDTVLSTFLFKLYTFDFQCNSETTCKNCQMTLLLWGVSEVERRLSTEDLWITLWNVVGKTTICLM